MAQSPRMREQRSEYRFNAGIDDSEHEGAESLDLEIVNGEYIRDGGISKRYGHTRVAPVGVPDVKRALLPHEGGLFIAGKDRAVMYQAPAGGTPASGAGTTAPAQLNWHASLRTVAEATRTAQEGSQDERGPTEVDGAVLEQSGRTYALLLLTRDHDHAAWYVYRTDSDALIAAGTVPLTSPKCGVIDISGVAQFVIAGIDSSGDMVKYHLTGSDSAGWALGAADVMFAGSFSTLIFDAWSLPDRSSMLCVGISGGNIAAVRTSEAANISVSHASPITVGSLGVTQSSDGFVHIAIGHGAGGTYRVLRLSNNLVSVLDTTTPGGQTTAVHYRIGVAAAEDTTAPGIIVLAETSVVTGDRKLSRAHMTTEHGSVATVVEHPYLVPLCKPFVVYPQYVATARDADEPVFACAVTCGAPNVFDDTGLATPNVLVRFPPTYVGVSGLIDGHPYVEPIALLAEAGSDRLPGLSTGRRGLANVYRIRDTDGKGDAAEDYYIPTRRLIQQLGNLESATGTLISDPQTWLARYVKLEHAMSDPLPRAQGHGLTFQGGALVRAWDGHSWGELAPLFGPRKPVVTEDTGDTSQMPAGTYTYYEMWVRNAGNGLQYRSRPSEGTAITKANAGAGSAIDVDSVVTIPTMHSESTGTLWIREVYRTEESGSVGRLIASVQTALEDGSPTTVTSKEADGTVGDNLLLYTVGELASSPPPAASAMAVHGNRLFLVDALNRRRVWYSKEFRAGYGPEFNVSLSFNAPEPVVALTSLDDKLVLHTSGNTYAVAGDGLDATGGGLNYLPELVSAGVGCTGPYNAAATPLGVLLHDHSGVKLLGRDLQVQDISGPISGLGSNYITSAPKALVHMPHIQRVYVLLGGTGEGSATTYVLDYARGKPRWLQFDVDGNLNGLYDAVWSAGRAWLLGDQTTDSILYRDPTKHSDDGSGFDFNIKLKNWRPSADAGLLDLVRVRRVHVVATRDAAANDGDIVTLTYRPRPNRTFGTQADEDYSWAWLQTEDGDYMHVETRVQQQRVTSADLELESVSLVLNEPGPVFHALVVDWVPVGRTARRGPGHDL